MIFFLQLQLQLDTMLRALQKSRSTGRLQLQDWKVKQKLK